METRRELVRKFVRRVVLEARFAHHRHRPVGDRRRATTRAGSVQIRAGRCDRQHRMSDLAQASWRRVADGRHQLRCIRIANPMPVWSSSSSEPIDISPCSIDGQGKTLSDVATAERVEVSEVSRILPLAFLSPSIVDSILAGTQPVSLTAQRLSRLADLPASWRQQSELLSRSLTASADHRADAPVQTFGNETRPLETDGPKLASQRQESETFCQVLATSGLASHGKHDAF